MNRSIVLLLLVLFSRDSLARCAPQGLRCATLRVTEMISKDQSNSKPCVVKGKLIKTKVFSSLNTGKENLKSVTFVTEDGCPKIGTILKGELQEICTDVVYQPPKGIKSTGLHKEISQPKEASRPEVLADYFLRQSKADDCN